MLNKSRSIELDYEIFRSEEGNILKGHNKMLMEENDKLARICEKYINEAKETTRMRGEIIRLNKELLEMKERSYGGRG